MVQKMMFRTKDNYIVIMDMPYGGTQLHAKKSEYTHFFAAHDYNDFIDKKNAGTLAADYSGNFDEKNSQFVIKQIHGYSYKKQPSEYKNETTAAAPLGMAPTLPDVDYTINDADVPQDIKNLGYKIEPYDVEWDVYLLGGEYKLFDKDGKEFDSTRASINTDNKIISVWRHHFKMDSATQNKMNDLIDEFKRSGLSLKRFSNGLSEPDKSLFSIYKNERQNNKNLRLTMCHEYKHCKITMFEDTVYFNLADKRVSAEQAALLKAHEECAPRISELVNQVNEYMKRGDWNNFKDFTSGEAGWLVSELRAMPADERKDFLKDPNNYVTKASEYWKTNHLDWYEKSQFGPHTVESMPRQGTVLDFIDRTPMFLPEDATDTTYKKIKKMYYHFAIYNPDSGKYEQKYLDKYVDSSMEELSDYAKTNIVPAAKARLAERQRKYDEDVHNGADISLLEQARSFMRHNRTSAEYIHPQNIYIESFDADYIAAHGISCADAAWSNHLQSYYQRLPNYTEIAKNDEEYTFKLGNDAIKYSSKNTLAVSKNSSFNTYMQILAEPSNKNGVVNFMPNMNGEQALMLYAACLASGRKMKGNIPTDLSGLDRLPGIDAATRNLINQRLGHSSATPTPSPTPTPSAQHMFYNHYRRGSR